MPIGDTDLSATKQELISALVQRELISAAVLMPSIRDVSAFAVKGAETISFPKANSFAVENRSTTVQATLQNITYAKDSLDLDFRATVSWLVDPMDEIESAINVEADLAGRAAREHGRYVDAQIIAELETVGDPTLTVGDLTKDIVLEMRQSLLTRKANPGALSLAVGPDQEAILLAIAEFVEADKYGSGQIPSGVLGRLYGVNVIVSQEIGVDTYYMYENEGCAIGMQKSLGMGERDAPEYGVGAKLKTMDQKFGVQGLQLGQQGVGAAESALVMKDAN